jgi:hypothetical protein
MTKKSNQEWLTKVRRYGSGESIVLIGTEEEAKEYAHAYNTQYQTDAAYAEPYTLTEPEKKDTL